MYFQEAGKIPYNGYIVTDVTKRTNVIVELIQNNDFWFYYDLKEHDTPETVAHDWYSDARHSWTIYLVNEIYDPFYQWYLTYKQLIDYSKLKYGDPDYQYTQYWLFDNVKYKTEPDITLDPNGLAVAVSGLDIEIAANDARQQIKLMYPEYINQMIDEYQSLI